MIWYFLFSKNKVETIININFIAKKNDNINFIKYFIISLTL